jgi:pyruvyltransferase
MITIGFSSKKVDNNFVEYIRKSCGLQKVEIIPFENPGTHSLSEAYNIILEQSSNDIVVLCHDDIYFEKDNWGNKVLKHFKRNSEYGIIGAAGSKYMPRSGKWWEVQTEMFGIVNHEHEGKKWTSKYSESKDNKLDDTVIVDGLFIAINKKNIKKTFNTDVTGFHFYDVDFCFRNFIEGVKVGVFYDIRITHKSIGMTNEQWELNRQQFAKTYEDKLPILLPTTFSKKNVNKNEPLVSIAMPIYNYAKRLNPTLQSVFSQDYTNFEIVIVNDGSTDEYCLMKLDSLKDHEGIRIVHKENTGVSSTRNRAVKESNGEYILPLDADDMILNGYLKTCVNTIKQNPNVSPVYCDTIHVGEMQGLQQRPEWSTDQLMKGPFIVNSSMYTKEAYNYVGGYDESLQGWEDYDFWLRMSKEGYVGKRIPKGLFVYFHHEKDGSVSTHANKDQQKLYQTIMSKNFMSKPSYEFNGRTITPDNTKNWGDLVPYKIIKELFNSDLNEDEVFNVKNPNKPYKIYTTGSVMLFTKPNSLVWGTGCIDEGMIGQTPEKVYAVRGPLTRQELLKKGIECPEVYGDPALLYPSIYNPKIEKKYKWGIIPHYIEFESARDREVLKNLENQGVKIIDICSGEQEFINELLEVENIISSSLHGLIIADAYGVPNAKVNISNKLIGGNFKFKDYYMSVNREIDYGLQLTKDTKLEDIEKLHFNTKIDIDLDKLISSSPWEYKNDLVHG